MQNETDTKLIAKGYLDDLKRIADLVSLDDIQNVVNVLVNAYKNDKRIFIFGNGGSAATSSHMACDIGKGTLKDVRDRNEKRFHVISLNDNIPLMTAIANDISYDEVFAQQLRNHLQEGDIVIGISASGNSPNVLKAFSYANETRAVTIGLLGFMTGGKAKDLVNHSIIIKSNSYGIVEDFHMVLNHIFTACLSNMKKNGL
ncbi:MAG: SIS domain-containing protein [Candidatus Aenigmarchaeota archaeon]|nr:SIS domain-containing protein [Candidatus Aenigmarchaeota archaeon]